MTIRTRRVYEPSSAEDGYRVLVDRVWPRGVRKQDAQLDDWRRDLAPSDELRRWFGHDPARFAEFRTRYLAELDEHSDLVDALVDRAREGDVTLVYAARDTEHNNAVLLRERVEERLR